MWSTRIGHNSVTIRNNEHGSAPAYPQGRALRCYRCSIARFTADRWLGGPSAGQRGQAPAAPALRTDRSGQDLPRRSDHRSAPRCPVRAYDHPAGRQGLVACWPGATRCDPISLSNSVSSATRWPENHVSAGLISARSMKLVSGGPRRWLASNVPRARSYCGLHRCRGPPGTGCSRRWSRHERRE